MPASLWRAAGKKSSGRLCADESPTKAEQGKYPAFRHLTWPKNPLNMYVKDLTGDRVRALGTNHALAITFAPDAMIVVLNRYTGQTTEQRDGRRVKWPAQGLARKGLLMNGWLTTCLACLIGMPATPVIAKPSVPQYRVVTTMVLGNPGGFVGPAQYLSIDSTTGRLYIASARSVIVVDTRKHKIAGIVPQVERVHCVALTPKRGRGYATLWEPNQVAVIDLKTMKTVETISVQTKFATGQWPKAIVYEPKTDRLFTFNGSSGDCTAIDARNNKVLDQIPLGGIPGCAVADGKGIIYANITKTNEVVAIDAKTLAIVKRWPLVWGESPTGIAFDSKHGRLFSTCANAKMVVSEPLLNRAIAALPIGKGACAVAYDPGTEMLFISNGEDGTVTVIQVRGTHYFSGPQTIPTLWGARTLALDEQTHHLFLVALTPPVTSGDYSGFGVLTLMELAPA